MRGSSSGGVHFFHHLLAGDIPPASAPALKGEGKRQEKCGVPSGSHQNQKVLKLGEELGKKEQIMIVLVCQASRLAR